MQLWMLSITFAWGFFGLFFHLGLDTFWIIDGTYMLFVEKRFPNGLP